MGKIEKRTTLAKKWKQSLVDITPGENPIVLRQIDWMKRIGIKDAEEFLRARTGILRGSLKKELKKIFLRNEKQRKITENLLQNIRIRIKEKMTMIKSI